MLELIELLAAMVKIRVKILQVENLLYSISSISLGIQLCWHYTFMYFV
jgi:hypothetical protein